MLPNQCCLLRGEGLEPLGGDQDRICSCRQISDWNVCTLRNEIQGLFQIGNLAARGYSSLGLISYSYRQRFINRRALEAINLTRVCSWRDQSG